MPSVFSLTLAWSPAWVLSGLLGSETLASFGAQQPGQRSYHKLPSLFFFIIIPMHSVPMMCL